MNVCGCRLSSKAASGQGARLRPAFPARLGVNTEELIAKESAVSAQNYSPLPVVLCRGQGVKLWDVDGGEFLDFLSAYSAVNQGHSHPRILAALTEQASRLALTSRAFYNDQLGEWCEFATRCFGYDRLMPMNTGVEACETSIKVARRWAYESKGVPPERARIVMAEGNFWGRSIAAVSSSCDPKSRNGFGPYVPGFDLVPYGDAAALEAHLNQYGDMTAAVMLEPIQGEAGVIVPPDGFLADVRRLCDKHNVLFIADEVQTGLGRTGYLLASDHENIKPDILVLGKALSGGIPQCHSRRHLLLLYDLRTGMYPVSAVLSSSDIMLLIRPGEHGSTYGGNPLACHVARAALDALLEENMVENAKHRGDQLERGLIGIVQRHDAALSTRGRGLLRALVINPLQADASDVCLALRDRGVLAKPTHNNVIRLAPPLVIEAAHIERALHAIEDAIAYCASRCTESHSH